MSSYKRASQERYKDVYYADVKVKNLVSVGLTGQFRLGELHLGNVDLNQIYFRSLVLVPTIGLSCGDLNKRSRHALKHYNHSDYRKTTDIGDAEFHNKAKMYELTLSVPLRWYFMTTNAAYSGAFLECGPLIHHIRCKNNLHVIGLPPILPFVDTKKGRWANTNYGLVVGIGKTEIYDKYQMTYGVSLHSAFGNGDDAKSEHRSEVNMHVSWTF